MRTKKLISMLLLPAAFVACTDDVFEDNKFSVNDSSKELIEDLTLGVSFDAGNASRAAYAGDADGNPYQNFYLEPDYNGKEVKLGDYAGLAGDMLGYCLTNGANAITNMPFYIAGYGTALSEAEGAKPTVYPLGNTALYDLGLDGEDYNINTVLQGANAKDSIDASIEAVAKKAAGEALGADSLDVRKGIVRTNAGVMTGNYIAYFPYNEDWTEPSGIPAVPVKALWNVVLKNERIEALKNVDVVEGETTKTFYDYMFAVSQQANEVKGGTKSGEVSLKPLTSAFTINLKNKTAEEDYDINKLEEIKRITIRSIEEGAAAFVLEGKVALNSLNTITASKSTDLIGASFEPTKIKSTDSLFLTIPFYPNPAVSGYVIEVYNTKGQVAAIERPAKNFELGTGYKATIDVKDLKFVNTTRKIFSEDDFIDEAMAGGDLMLMTDIEVKKASELKVDSALNIMGAKKLTLHNGTYNGKITMDEGSELILNGATVNDINADKVVLKSVYELTNSLVANTLINEQTLTLKGNATINTWDIYGGATAEKRKVTADVYTTIKVGTLNNYSSLHAKGLEVTTLNNKAIAINRAVLYVYDLTATTINNEGSVADNPQTDANEYKMSGDIQVLGKTNKTAVNNSGSIKFGDSMSNTAADFKWAVENKNDGTIALNYCPNFMGEINNEGFVNVNNVCSVEGVSGEVNNAANGIIYINGYFGFTTTKLNINAGKVIVNGSINGNNNITVAEGAEFIATAANENVLLSTLSDNFINAKYTGIKVSSTVWPSSVTATSKKIYLQNNISLSSNLALNGGLVVEGKDVTVTPSSYRTLSVSEIVVNKDKALTFAANLNMTVTGNVTINGSLEIGETSNVTVNGKITNNGTYKQAGTAVVWCGGIVTGQGATWVNKPNY